MKFHKQLIVDHGRGDCWRTCAACILDLEVLDVPNFSEMEGKNKSMWDFATEWANSTGYSLVKIESQGQQGCTYFRDLNLFMAGGALCIGSIPSQRFHRGQHAVVCQVKTDTINDTSRAWVDIIHDPSPSNPPYPWFADINSLTFFVKSYAPAYPDARQTYPE